MESDSISMIEERPTPESVREVQVLLGIANFYRRFIRKYAKVTAPIPNILKTQGSRMGKWTRDAELAFRKLQKAFTKTPILQDFNSHKLIILQTDVSGLAIAGILNQYDGFGFLRPVDFNSGHCTPAEEKYDTYNREL
jgi:hypothetical protein